MSGGMSLLGTVAAAFGASLMMLFGYSRLGGSWLLLLIGGISAFAGCIFDSFLGSLVQEKYRCAVCGKLTEKDSHCGKPAAHVRGLRGIDNDTVNFCSSLFAAVLAIVLCFVF